LEFSEWLRGRRKAIGWNQAQLGTTLGVSQAVISQWETGKAEPTDEAQQWIREKLGEGSFKERIPEDQSLPGFEQLAESRPARTTKTARAKRKSRKTTENGEGNTGSIGFESKLWNAADLLRSNMDPAEYKHVVLGLLFLKYISDAFDERHQRLQDMVREPESEYYVAGEEAQRKELEYLLEERDEYTLAGVFWVPPGARWSHIRASAKQPEIGRIVDDAMVAIERDNRSLKGVLPKVYALPNLDKVSLGKLIDLVSSIGLGYEEHRAKDTLGRVYEYFLARFASAEGKGGGEFYTPTSVVRVLVEMLEPYQGRVYDPCCGSGGMFVQSLRFIEAHGGLKDQVSIYGQESNATTWKLSRMNLAIRGIEANIGVKHADSFREDLHPDLRADFILANPPFNVSQWHGELLRDDVRWRFGAPPVGNANFAWVQHFIHHLAPGGVTGFVLANGSMSSMQSGEGEIRRRIVEADLVDCIVAMPPQLFYATQIPVCLWFLAKDRRNGKFRDRHGETLFIDARTLGRMETRVHRVLEQKDIEEIAGTYHAWRNPGGEYDDMPGFCRSVTMDDITSHGFVLTPGRYVGVEEETNDCEPFEERMVRLTRQLSAHLAESAELDKQIRIAMVDLGYDV
jgi:type I restriction enzyme M protein